MKQQFSVSFAAGQASTALGMDVGLGAKVAMIAKGSLAELNDVRIGDRILTINEKSIAVSLAPKKINSMLKAEYQKGDVMIQFGRYTEAGEELSSLQQECCK